MPLTKKTYDWAVTGTKTTPSAARQQSGWVPGEQPTIGDENWIQNGQDVAVRELQTGDNPETTFKDLTEDQFAQKLNTDTTTAANSWPYPWSQNNIYAASSTADTLEDLAISYPGGSKRLLVLETATGEIQVFDPLDVTLDYTISNANLVAGLPATAGAWLPLAMCTDATYVYVVFEETGVGSPKHYVQSYKVEDGTVNSSWPGTGTQITSGFLNATSWTGQDNRTTKIIFGSPTILITLNSWVGAVYSGGYSNTDPVLSAIVVADGTLGIEGAGDIGSVANFGTLYGFGGLASFYNGTNYYIAFTLADQTNYRGIVCSDDVGLSGSGAGGAFPIDLGTNNVVCQSMYYDGRHLWMPTRNLAAGGVIGQTALYKFEPNAGSTDSLNSDPDYPSIKEIAGDGINAYLTTRVGDNPGGAHTNTKHNTIQKLNAVGMYPSASSVYSDISNDVVSRYNLEEAGRNPSVASNRDTLVDYLGPMLFDGRDLWIIQDIRDGATYSFGSQVFRVPRTAIR
jgi:hypothetical protein